jgi:hypothetical protein
VNRRALLAGICALPFAGRAAPKPAFTYYHAGPRRTNGPSERELAGEITAATAYAPQSAKVFTFVANGPFNEDVRLAR